MTANDADAKNKAKKEDRDHTHINGFRTTICGFLISTFDTFIDKQRSSLGLRMGRTLATHTSARSPYWSGWLAAVLLIPIGRIERCRPLPPDFSVSRERVIYNRSTALSPPDGAVLIAGGASEVAASSAVVMRVAIDLRFAAVCNRACSGSFNSFREI